jgi:putative CocE/NonD family hydrolase
MRRHNLVASTLALWPGLVVSIAGLAQAQGPPAAPEAPGFTVSEAMVPMRDGVRLHTVIYTPTGTHAPLPILFIRTPYGADAAFGGPSAQYKELVADGYIFVFQDIRGRYTSEGRFVMQRAPRDRKDSRAIDESTDAYDSIDWLIKQIANNNGRVGMLGISYPGWLTVMAMLDPHPALKAVSPQASPIDMFLGDDFHHNGAFRLSYGFEYATRMETNKEQAQFEFDSYDTYTWFLRLGGLSNANAKYLHGTIPTWNDFVDHPNFDDFWQHQTAISYMDRVRVPTLNVAGWWDQEDFYGPVTIYRALEKHDTDHKNFLVVGPWNHGGWAAPDGQKLGNIDFGSPTSLYFRQHVLAPFFAYYLKDQGTLNMPEALTFEAGDNIWRRHDAWPPRDNITVKKLYFQPGGRAGFEPVAPPVGDSGFDAYVSDPAHPVPYRNRPVPPLYMPGGSGWTTWLLQDQRFADGRPDVLTWETAPLSEDVVIAGDIAAHLFASTTGTDADWVAKLIDVYPDVYPQNPPFGGYELMVSNDVFRGRFRHSFTSPEPIKPGVVEEYTIDLHTQDYRFLKGHRIMVQVQSTWFPLIDRNPQNYVPNIFKATDSDFRAARQRVYRALGQASYIQLPVESGEAPRADAAGSAGVP